MRKKKKGTKWTTPWYKKIEIEERRAYLVRSSGVCWHFFMWTERRIWEALVEKLQSEDVFSDDLRCSNIKNSSRVLACTCAREFHQFTSPGDSFFCFVIINRAPFLLRSDGKINLNGKTCGMKEKKMLHRTRNVCLCDKFVRFFYDRRRGSHDHRKTRTKTKMSPWIFENCSKLALHLESAVMWGELWG